MKQFFLWLTLIAPLTISAQEYQVPKEYILKSDEDYAKYTSDIEATIQWLQDTPLDQQPVLRQQASAFLMAWLSGTPEVTIVLSSRILKFSDCAACLTIYFGGWTQFVLDTGVQQDIVQGNLAGIKAAIAFYQKNRGLIERNKVIEKFIKKQAKGKLEAYIISKL